MRGEETVGAANSFCAEARSVNFVVRLDILR